MWPYRNSSFPYLFSSLQPHTQFHLMKIQSKCHLFQQAFLEVSHLLCSLPPMTLPALFSWFSTIPFHCPLNWTMVSCICPFPWMTHTPCHSQNTSVSILLSLHNTKSLIVCWLLSVFPKKEETVSPQKLVTGISGWGRPWAHLGRALWTAWARGSKRGCPQDLSPTSFPQMLREDEQNVAEGPSVKPPSLARSFCIDPWGLASWGVEWFPCGWCPLLFPFF